MIDHFEIKVTNLEACQQFYSRVLLPLNIELKWSDDFAAGFGVINDSKVRFLIEKQPDSQASLPSPAHIAFSAENPAAVDAFHQQGIAGQYTCNGKPGFRKDYAPNYYAAFLLDPDGNNIEAVVYTDVKD
ncbi:VOC family protein [Parendozoicomonas haliclonae]|uniref:Glyoxalase-like domain protein n=1 Tax=Parendozoicomonas haliclonae TaxID=1960125 RepID=A0A1X7AIP4_9GAMM|nr:VOC family protein [Parendozoicomonas haliclonae]SMA44089.1 Glyoxalase-like domain protein [Parendozoicomonas haliclonae]